LFVLYICIPYSLNNKYITISFIMVDELLQVWRFSESQMDWQNSLRCFIEVFFKSSRKLVNKHV